MNRTDRLYALVEELRAVSPRPRSSTWLARRFEVSARTVERDLGALREAGVPITSDVGRAGGYFLERERVLPPLTLSAEEALAISVALRAAGDTPYASAARQAVLKVLAVLPPDVRRREEALAHRVHRVGEHVIAGVGQVAGQVAATVTTAVASGRVVTVDYVAADGCRTRRDVEPLGLLWGPHGWYLMGWCRLRQAVRGFQLARIVATTLTSERPPVREAEMQAELDRLDAQPLPM